MMVVLSSSLCARAKVGSASQAATSISTTQRTRAAVQTGILAALSKEKEVQLYQGIRWIQRRWRRQQRRKQEEQQQRYQDRHRPDGQGQQNQQEHQQRQATRVLCGPLAGLQDYLDASLDPQARNIQSSTVTASAPMMPNLGFPTTGRLSPIQGTQQTSTSPPLDTPRPNLFDDCEAESDVGARGDSDNSDCHPFDRG